MNKSGWFGRLDQVLAYLAAVHADRDENGDFCIYGEPVSAGYDGDAAVPAGAEYSVKGRRCNLAAGLSSTSYGTKVGVY
tara:strand:- start:1491 stop:1727 length:237 start_codon:yes stop_codon:yes gene_type:complete